MFSVAKMQIKQDKDEKLVDGKEFWNGRLGVTINLVLGSLVSGLLKEARYD